MILINFFQKISILFSGSLLLKMHYYFMLSLKKLGLSTQKFNRKFYSISWYTKHYYMCEELEDRLFRLLQLTSGKTKEQVAYLLRAAESKKAFHESICLKDLPPFMLHTIVTSPSGKEILTEIDRHKQSLSFVSKFNKSSKLNLPQNELFISQVKEELTPYLPENDCCMSKNNLVILEKTWP